MHLRYYNCAHGLSPLQLTQTDNFILIQLTVAHDTNLVHFLMAKVYVGTYKKYNEGSIAGGWLDLADYPTYKDFLTACKKLHKNEHDPEYMIQDTEDFPDGLSCLEWLSEQDFNDVKAAMGENTPSIRIVDYSEKCFAVVGDTFPIREQLKALGAWKFNKFLSCGAGWLFNNDKREAVEAFINSGVVTAQKPAEKDDNNKFAAWLDEFVKTQCKTPSDVKYYGKGNVGAVKINGHYLLIDKPSIENRFCFHDEGPNYEFYKTLCADDNKMRQYFISENEAAFTNKIKAIEKGEEVRIKDSDYMHQFCLYIGRHYYEPSEGREATAEERALILEGLKFGLAKFRKRLDAYLNRYGLSKLHTWTYWADA